jgi:hypothetical protein
MSFPTSPAQGDLYVHGSVTYCFNGSNWQSTWGVALNASGTQMISKTIEPTGMSSGSIWLNPITNEIKKFDGSVWTSIGTIGA